MCKTCLIKTVLTLQNRPYVTKSLWNVGYKTDEIIVPLSQKKTTGSSAKL